MSWVAIDVHQVDALFLLSRDDFHRAVFDGTPVEELVLDEGNPLSDKGADSSALAFGGFPFVLWAVVRPVARDLWHFFAVCLLVHDDVRSSS